MGTKQNWNDITDGSRVQVRFCSHFSFFPIPFHVLVPRFPFPVLVTSVNLFSMIVDICGFSDRLYCGFASVRWYISWQFASVSPFASYPTGVTATRNTSWTELYQQNL